MNIFVLDTDITRAAEAHLDRHVVKMIIEYAQLLSTAHRLNDGKLQLLKYDDPIYKAELLSDGSYKETLIGTKAKEKKVWVLPGEKPTIQYFTDLNLHKPEVGLKTRAVVEIENRKCYNVTHQNHPSAVWARETSSNYMWLAMLFKALCREYTYRYGKVHKTESTIGDYLIGIPKRMTLGEMTPFAQAMPDEYKDEDAVRAYRNYYLGPKAAIAKWTRRPVPDWFKNNYKDYNGSDFERTNALA